MKRQIKTISVFLVLAFALAMFVTVSAATPREMIENGEVSDGDIRYGDARDGIVSDVSEGGEIVPGEGTGLISEIENITDAPDTSRTAESSENTSGTTNGADDEEGGIGMGIIIAVLVIIAVVIIIFLLLPKRRS